MNLFSLLVNLMDLAGTLGEARAGAEDSGGEAPPDGLGDAEVGALGMGWEAGGRAITGVAGWGAGGCGQTGSRLGPSEYWDPMGPDWLPEKRGQSAFA